MSVKHGQASSEKQAQYNHVAKKYSEKLVQHRADVREKLGASVRPIESLFPDFNKVGLGVHLEFARMGNQPVTDELQEWAEALDIHFEHLGLTLGTVLHNVDLKHPLTAELVAFIRDALLERKVIFSGTSICRKMNRFLLVECSVILMRFHLVQQVIIPSFLRLATVIKAPVQKMVGIPM